MLELKNIRKIYNTEGIIVEALKGITLTFRDNEFVSILGQSGCGKTTMLNIVGGLDQYSNGDLVIDGISTKEYKDHDWDIYRNNTIGFVFQSYNLIPHQTVLSNVELSLTLSGVSKLERRNRAIEALTKVGLLEHINKKPNQLSGGQMQRVAIARALVNNPKIVLADEPTGALDTQTSIQIMELLKEIAKDRLVIMVTHNPDLAKSYSTRIINLLDGKIIDDSNPVKDKEIKEAYKNFKPYDKKKKKLGMSFITALSLSFKNLMTKKGRTILTAFAGSIGIIGIALILSLSSGFQSYINRVEEDTLSSYPLEIEDSSYDLSKLMDMYQEHTTSTNETSYEDGYVYSKDTIESLASSISVYKNDLTSFKAYIDENIESIEDNVTEIQYRYNVSLNIYDNTDTIQPLYPFAFNSSSLTSEQLTAQSSINRLSTYDRLFDNEEFNNAQYEVLAGKWPSAYNELILIANKDHTINDYVLYSAGLLSASDLLSSIGSDEKVERRVSYNDIINKTLKMLPSTELFYKSGDVYKQYKLSTSAYGITSNQEYFNNVQSILDNKGIELKIVGVACPTANSSDDSAGKIGYTTELVNYLINYNNSSDIVNLQKQDETKSILTGADITTEEQLQQTYESLGLVNKDNPSAIYFYTSSFTGKEAVKSFIEQYNETNKDNESKQIKYNDTVALLTSGISTIIDAISYVLIAFVSISLVVSSIMIGIITNISVLERTKEIGVLRSIGASKKDIKRVFNAETFFLGLTAGLLGIGITILLDIPINMILKELANIDNVAKLPLAGGIGLIIISVILTLIAGLIPASKAARQDPVVALRSE